MCDDYYYYEEQRKAEAKSEAALAEHLPPPSEALWEQFYHVLCFW